MSPATRKQLPTGAALAVCLSVLLHAGGAWLLARMPKPKPPPSRPVEMTIVRVTRPLPVTPPVLAPPPAVLPPVRKTPVSKPAIAAPPPVVPVVPPVAVVEEKPVAPPETAPSNAVILPAAPVAPSPDGVASLFKGGARTQDGAGTVVGPKPGLGTGTLDAARQALKEPPPPAPTTPAALAAPEWKYKDFFDRVKQAVKGAWRPDKAIMARVERDEAKGVRSGRTVLALTLDAVGRLVDAVVAEPGAAPFLDEEALKAVSRAAPFINPPKTMVDAEGRIHFNVGFEVVVRPPDAVRRLLEPHGNIAEAVMDAFAGNNSNAVRWCMKRVESCGRECVEAYPSLKLVAEPCAL